MTRRTGQGARINMDNIWVYRTVALVPDSPGQRRYGGDVLMSAGRIDPDRAQRRTVITRLDAWVARQEEALRRAPSTRAGGWALAATTAVLLFCGTFPWGRL